VDFPPWRTVYDYFARWRDDGTLRRVHDQLRALARQAAGRDREPTAAVIDSQSARAADTVPKASRGWDNAKKVNGCKRHIAVDTGGLLLTVLVTAASVQDRDAAKVLLWNMRRTCHRIILAWADAGYTGKLTTWTQNHLHLGVVIVRRREAHTFSRPAPPLGRRTDLRLGQQAPPHRPRLRAPALKPRSHGALGHDRSHGRTPGPGRRHHHDRLTKHSLSLSFNLRVRVVL
jgi:transposase